MPHFVIDCSENVLELKTPAEIMNAVYGAAETTGLFAENDIKVRLQPYRYYRLGEGKSAFVHIFGYIMQGRSVEQKAALSKTILRTMNGLFPQVEILSMNVSEFDRETYSNKSLIHPGNGTNDRHFLL